MPFEEGFIALEGPAARGGDSRLHGNQFINKAKGGTVGKRGKGLDKRGWLQHNRRPQYPMLTDCANSECSTTLTR
ncbi:hypothetical protein GCM10023213_38670 [Prosthecobacter algae]|uniref:Uncharacterized protein n=1 Tax=Prosthecobacter algae TaxID=1144682 RepID=A0ABP9PI45_9BACT